MAFPDPAHTPANVQPIPQVVAPATRILIAELKSATRADLLRTDSITPRGLVLLQAACRTQVHAGDRPRRTSAHQPQVACHRANDSAFRPPLLTTIAPMQPLAELTLTRPWHWGIAVLGDPKAEVPTESSGAGVAIGRNVVTLSVRHAQDIDGDKFEGEWDWATATIHLRSLVQSEKTARHVLCDIVIATPGEAVSLGDADGMVVIPVPSPRTRLIVCTDDVDPTGLETVWIDLVAVED